MLLTADKIIYNGYAYSQVGIRIENSGRIGAVGPLRDLGTPDKVLRNRVIVPGFVNAHSHCFQRLLRGRSQVSGPQGDSFWTWRQAMYWVAQHLEPESMYIVARQAFIEMLRHGITSVGEFHYVHNQPNGTPYPESYAMADAMLHAARDAGIRLSVIHTVYLRGDFNRAPSAAQARFCAPSLDAACENFDQLVEHIIGFNDPRLSWAIAAHSLRGVPLDGIVGLKVRLSHMPFHVHISEQRREVEGCIEAYGEPPVQLLARAEVLDACTTLVHATHLQPGEAQAIAHSGAAVCFCPTTEADLGDGIGPANTLFQLGVPLCLGTDGATTLSILQEARGLEMQERLRLEARNVLVRGPGESPATHLMKIVGHNGALSLGLDNGSLQPGQWADFVSFDLDDPALVGTDAAALPAALLFSADQSAVRDVVVGGRWVVESGQHPLQGESATTYARLAERLFEQSPLTPR